ncbi:hypothetical protein CDD83_7110 [Cordyceps sp. RAO-2017]|nr:hypothetical protein CDD83_7110 [Cordyceps sp. RAO-2017]
MVFSLSLYCFSPGLFRWGDYVRQTNPFSGQDRVEQDFTPTSRELACLYGLPPRPGQPPLLSSSHTSSSSESELTAANSIPNVAHFIFLQKLPLDHAGQGDFNFLSYLSVRSAIVSLKPTKVLLHYGYVGDEAHRSSEGDGADPLIRNNEWIERLRHDVEFVRHDGPLNSSLQHSEHLADKLRLEILLEHGGIYLDIDAFALRPFTHVLESPHPHDVVMGNEGGNRAGLCNAVMAARPNSTFVKRWLETYETADLNAEWNYHSVLLPKQLAGQHPDEICELPPDSFFWPTWTWRHVEWMHEPLDQADTRRWQKRIQRTGGSLFDNQLAYHAWSQMARDRYLRRLTPEVVRNEDTRFNLLVRRFIAEDL